MTQIIGITVCKKIWEPEKGSQPLPDRAQRKRGAFKVADSVAGPGRAKM